VAIDPFDVNAEAQLGRLALKRKDAVTPSAPSAACSARSRPILRRRTSRLAEAHLAAGQMAEAKRHTLAALEIAPSFEGLRTCC
jgi:hypothetical protein